MRLQGPRHYCAHLNLAGSWPAQGPRCNWQKTRHRGRNGLTYASQRTVFAEESVVIKTSDSVLVQVEQRRDPGCSLAAYMRLPVSQFVLIEVPLGGELRRSGYDIFDLVVSPLSFFDLWVQPHVRCRVRQLTEPECVDIQCVDFQLRSSPAVERLRLNHRVRFAVTTRFSCEGAPGREGIRSTTHMQAEVAPPAPFSYLPDSVLVAVGTAALHGALANLQHTFIRSLAKDYARWATDARYRAERLRWAKRSDEAVAGAASTPPLSGLTL